MIPFVEHKLTMLFSGPDNSRNLLFPGGDVDSHLTHGSLGPHESSPKRHLDRFSHFCTVHQCDQHTDTQTQIPHYM